MIIKLWVNYYEHKKLEQRLTDISNEQVFRLNARSNERIVLMSFTKKEKLLTYCLIDKYMYYLIAVLFHIKNEIFDKSLINQIIVFEGYLYNS